MRQFKDTAGGSWDIDLSIGNVMRVKGASEGRFNLISPAKELHDELTTDEGTFWELLWFLVEMQAKERNITAEQFGKAMAADCLHDARRLFFEAWRDFFHQLARADKMAVVEKAAQYMNKAMELTVAKLKSPDMTKVDQLAEQRMTAALNKSFGELLDSLESTPAPSPGESSTP